MGVEELQAVEIELDGAQGVGCQKIGEIVGQLRPDERSDPVVEAVFGPAEGAGVSQLTSVEVSSYASLTQQPLPLVPIKAAAHYRRERETPGRVSTGSGHSAEG